MKITNSIPRFLNQRNTVDIKQEPIKGITKKLLEKYKPNKEFIISEAEQNSRIQDRAA
tara:strand:- start:2169 stop:2342 length:174 start_codon:yes stop_codon:yes gene_type:complete